MGKAENKIELYLVRKIKSCGYFICKFTSPAQNGMPDRLVIANGHTYYIELKTEKGSLQDNQIAIIKKMRTRYKAIVLVIDNRDDVDTFVETLQQGHDAVVELCETFAPASRLK